MTKQTTLQILSLGCLLAIAGCTKPVDQPASSVPAGPPTLKEDKRVTSVEVVKAEPQAIEIAAGGAGEAIVRLTIQHGYHINANPPTYSYLKATELEIAPSEGVVPGKPVYPKALDRKFAFAEKPLAVYEAEVELKAPLKVDKSASPGSKSLAAKLRVQACDEAVCYPPGTIDLVIPVSIR